jgi:hypothetical protein
MDSRAETDLLIEEYRGICESFSLTTTFNQDLVESTRASADEVVGNFSERGDGLLTEGDKVTIRRAIDVMSGELLLVSDNPIMSTYNKLKKPVRTITKDDEKNFLDLNYGILKKFEEALKKKIKDEKIKPPKSETLTSIIKKIEDLGKRLGGITLEDFRGMAYCIQLDIGELQKTLSVALENKKGDRIYFANGWTFIEPLGYNESRAPIKHRFSISIPPVPDFVEKMRRISERFFGIFKFKLPYVAADVFKSWTRIDPVTIYVQDDNHEIISRIQAAVIEEFNLSPDAVIDNSEPTREDTGETYQSIEQAHETALKHFEALHKQYELLSKQQSASGEKKEYFAMLSERRFLLMKEELRAQQRTLGETGSTLIRDVKSRKQQIMESHVKQHANLLAQQQLYCGEYRKQCVDLLAQQQQYEQRHVDLLKQQKLSYEEHKEQCLDLLAQRQRCERLHAQRRADLLAKQQQCDTEYKQLCDNLLAQQQRCNRFNAQQRANLLAKQRQYERLHAQRRANLLAQQQLYYREHKKQCADLLAQQQQCDRLYAQRRDDLLVQKQYEEACMQQRADLLTQQPNEERFVQQEALKKALEKAELRAKLCVDLLEKVKNEYNGRVTNGSSSVGIEDSVHITLQFIQSLNIESSDKELASLSELIEIRERQKEMARRK